MPKLLRQHDREQGTGTGERKRVVPVLYSLSPTSPGAAKTGASGKVNWRALAELAYEVGRDLAELD
jgi:hypothetical protein